MDFVDEPLPRLSDDVLARTERMCGVTFPETFKDFLGRFNGARPVDGSFDIPTTGQNKVIERFLACVEDIEDPLHGWADIAVITSQIDDRLIYELTDSVGVTLVPIALLFAGDYLVLDYRDSSDDPSVGVWFHEQSPPLAPYVETVAESFPALLELLQIPM